MKCYKYSLNSQILSKRAMGQLNWGYNSEFTLTPKCLQFSDPKSPKRSLPNQRVTWEYDDSPVDLAGFTMVFHQFFRQSHISYDHKVWDQMLLYFPLFSHMVPICFPHFPIFPMCFPMFPTVQFDPRGLTRRDLRFSTSASTSSKIFAMDSSVGDHRQYS